TASPYPHPPVSKSTAHSGRKKARNMAGMCFHAPANTQSKGRQSSQPRILPGQRYSLFAIKPKYVSAKMLAQGTAFLPLTMKDR
ncbi:MAG: hypothetical protein ACPGSI_07035, partial [Pikeienuella sp.]